jgi:hypothetical protein
MGVTAKVYVQTVSDEQYLGSIWLGVVEWDGPVSLIFRTGRDGSTSFSLVDMTLDRPILYLVEGINRNEMDGEFDVMSSTKLSLVFYFFFRNFVLFSA